MSDRSHEGTLINTMLRHVKRINLLYACSFCLVFPATKPTKKKIVFTLQTHSNHGTMRVQTNHASLVMLNLER